MAITITVSAQPFTESELGWRLKATNAFVTPESIPVAFPTFNIIPENNGPYHTTNNGTCVTSTNLSIFSFLTGGQPFNGKATNLGDFADFTLGFNWIYGVVDYAPNLNFTGYDQFTYIVTNNISRANVFVTAINQYLMYSTNDGVQCYGLQSFNNTGGTVILPPPTGSNQIFYIYANGCFTNAYTFQNGAWTGPSGNVVGRAVGLIVNCQGNLCTAYTNFAIPSTNFCGTNYTDNLSNVVWTGRSLGSGSGTVPSATNDVVFFNAKLCTLFNGGGLGVGTTVCGGATNRTILVTGIVTNTAQTTFSDTFNISMNFANRTNFPVGSGVYPFSFTYTLTAQSTNTPEFEFLMNKTQNTSPPNNCNSMSGVLTNTIQ